MESVLVKFKQINEKTGKVELKSGILEGMTAVKACIKNMSGTHMVDFENVEGYYF